MDFDDVDKPAWCQNFQIDVPESAIIPEQEERDRRKAHREKVISTQSLGNIRKGMMRHLVLVVDTSKKWHPNLRNCLESFIIEFFDQNPIAQMSILITYNAIAKKLTDFSGTTSKHIEALSQLKFGGEPSLQNTLELANICLSLIPNYGSKEILLVYGSINTCDPGDVFEIIEKVKANNIRVSIVGWNAEVFILRKLASETQGSYHIPVTKEHFKELLSDHSPPPPALVTKGITAKLVCMGFPEKQSSAPGKLLICVCHQQKRESYSCPRCSSRWCNLPTDCNVCGLPLIASPHLARSYHHLFPLKSFKEVTLDVSGDCFSCRATLSTVEGESSYQCESCKQLFCYDCDMFTHETLHNCPGCELITDKDAMQTD